MITVPTLVRLNHSVSLSELHVAIVPKYFVHRLTYGISLTIHTV